MLDKLKVSTVEKICIIIMCLIGIAGIAYMWASLPEVPKTENHAVAPSTTTYTATTTMGPMPQQVFPCPLCKQPAPTRPEPEYVPTIEERVDAMVPEDERDPNIDWHGSYRVETSYEPVTTISGQKVDAKLREFLAKMTYAESGAMSWWGQVYTCSAIINHCELKGKTLWDAGHNINHFAVAPWVDTVKPEQLTYDVVDYVLAGGRIEELCYFRSGGMYHDFAKPVCQVDDHYFSVKEK
jgi:hypothetical protein